VSNDTTRPGNDASVLPLRGCRVLDFGWAVAAPTVGLALADMGAEVLRVESRGRLDGLRLGESMARQASGMQDPSPDVEMEMHPLFHIVNRAKLGITVNIRKPEGVALVRQMARLCDVVIENFSPGVLDRVGLGYRDLRRERPDVVMLSMSSMGQSGPLRDVTTYAPTIASLVGLHGLIGYPDRLLGMAAGGFADANAGLMGVFAVLASLRYRQRTGQGQYIDMSQGEATAVLMGEALIDNVMNKRVQRPAGNARPGMAPYGVYPCKGNDQWVSIAVKTQAEWEALCRAVGNPEWTREDTFADAYSRKRNSDALDKRLGEWTRQHTPEEATERLQAHGVAAAPVLDIGQVYRHPQFQARQAFVHIEHPYIGKEAMYGTVWRLSGTPGGVFRRAPFLGEHNSYAFGDLLGLPRDSLERLRAEQAIS